MRIAVFCSCSENVAPTMFGEMEQLGAALAEDGHTIVYGGAKGGCMSALARGVQSRRGRLVGVVPQMDFMTGLVQEGLTEQHVVKSLSDRKIGMIERADAFLVFPGGLGTLDEALEVLALKSIGTLEKPVVFYNYLDVWTPFLEAMALLEQQRFIRDPMSRLFVVLDKVEQVREHFRDAL